MRSFHSGRRGELWLVVGLFAAITAAMGRNLATPSAEFDEGVYLASGKALAGGANLGSELFASQPPLFFEGLAALHILGRGHDVVLRGFSVGLALLAVAVAYVIVRRLAGRFAAIAAAVLVSLAPAVIDRAAVVSADVPAVALAIAAVACVPWALRSDRGAIATGALAAGALMIKLLAAPVLLALLVALIVRRPSLRSVAVAVIGATTTIGLVVFAGGSSVSAVWEGVVGIRGAARAVQPAGTETSGLALGVTLGFASLVGALLIGLLINPPQRLRTWALDRAEILALLAGGIALIGLHKPVFEHHLVVIAIPLAILAASAWPASPEPRTVAVLMVVILGLTPAAFDGRRQVTPIEREQMRAVAGLVRMATLPGESVVSDLPMIPLMADRKAPPNTIDASYVRVMSGNLSKAQVLKASEHAEAVVAGRAFLDIPGLDRQLRTRFPEVRRFGTTTVYFRGMPLSFNT